MILRTAAAGALATAAALAATAPAPARSAVPAPQRTVYTGLAVLGSPLGASYVPVPVGEPHSACRRPRRSAT